MFKIHDLPYYYTLLGYAGIFLYFITVDQVSFVPEEISLLTIGYFASKGVFDPFIAGLISLVAFLTVDTAYYFLANSGGKRAKRLQDKIEHSFLRALKEKFRKNFPKTLFFICFIPRMRLWGPLVSGLMQIPYSRFIKYDSLILGVFTAIYISSGVIFHKGLKTFIFELESLQNIIFFCTALVFTIFILIVARKCKHKQY